MTLPWNRGDGDGAADSLVGLVPLLGTDSGDGGAGTDEEPERRDPILVAPHRDPGEQAVNNRLPPGFERGRRASQEPASPDEARRPADEPPAADPASAGPADDEPSPSDRTPGDPSPADPSPAEPSQADPTPAGRTPADPSPASAEPAEADPAAVGTVTAADESGGAPGDVDGASDEARERDGPDDEPGDDAEDSTATLAVNDG